MRKINNHRGLLSDEDKKIRDRLFYIFNDNKFYRMVVDELDINISYSFLKLNQFLLN